jgi:hypothetical protein
MPPWALCHDQSDVRMVEREAVLKEVAVYQAFGLEDVRAP